MNFQRSPRRLLGFALATALTFGGADAPARAKTDKSAEKTADAEKAAKPAKPSPAKSAGTKSAKPAPKTAAVKAKTPKAAQPHKEVAQKSVRETKHVPVPRSKPDVAAIPALAPARATLSPIQILPTTSFAPAKLPVPAVTVPADIAAPPPSPRIATLSSTPLIATEGPKTPPADVALVKQALDLVSRGKTSAATAMEPSIGDPLARKLVEWAIVRSDGNDAGFDRYAAFSNQNPSWPNAVMIRKRAEGALWDERRGNETVRAFFASSEPTTAKGKFALARALLSQGDQAGAAQLVRSAWREDVCSPAVERAVIDTFGDMLTRADHKARMDRRFYDDDPDAGMRMAQLLGGSDLLIGKARKAVVEKSGNAHALLEAVPESARRDAGYIFHKAQLLRREDKPVEAARLIQSAPHDASQQHNLDEWWIERRLIARELLDEGEYQAAYVVARDALPPTKENLRAEHEFTAGWIALRFAHNPKAAYQHFARVGEGATNPITLARGEYWQGRAAEAAGNTSAARSHYQAAAEHPTAYYGQIARAKLGLGELNLRRPPEPTHRAALMNLEVVRAVQLLYASDARELVVPFVTDLADKAIDTGALVIVAEIARKNNDARAMLLVGKAGLNRGYSFDIYAFPINGIPNFRDRRPGDRQERGFRHCPPGKRLQSARGLARQGARPDAGTARHRKDDREEVRLSVRSRSDALRRVL